MRKIISQGLNTVMEGVFSRPEFRPAVESSKPRKPGKKKDRKAGHAWQIKKPLAVMFILLTSANVFAETQGATVGEVMRASEQNQVAQTAPVKRIDMRKQSGNRQLGQAKPATRRVYLDDYQLLPKAATRQHPTKAHRIGQRDKTRK
jgi:hypothetical protein